MKVLRAEYWSDRFFKWVSYYEFRETPTDEELNFHLNFPMVGNPDRRLAEYEKTGVRKVKYQYIRTLTEVKK